MWKRVGGTVHWHDMYAYTSKDGRRVMGEKNGCSDMEAIKHKD